MDDLTPALPLPAAGAGAFLQVPLAHLRPHPAQPRTVFDPGALEELAASLREVGVLQPLLVRPDPQREGAYEIVAGERRWRAAQIAGLECVPAIALPGLADDAAALEAAVTENLQRADLTPLEEAVILRRMTDELGYSVRRLAQRLGKGKGYVEDRLRLARLPEDLRALVAARPDALTHAREIEGVADPALRAELIAATREGAPLAAIRRRIQACLAEQETAEESRDADDPETDETVLDEVSGRPDRGGVTEAEDATSLEEEAPEGDASPLVRLRRVVWQLREAAQDVAVFVASSAGDRSAERVELRDELRSAAGAIAGLLAFLDHTG